MQYVCGQNAPLDHAADVEVELPPRRRAGELDPDHRRGLPDPRHRGHRGLPAASPRPARPCGRWPTTGRSPPCSACPCGGSRRRRGSARGSCAAIAGLLLSNLVGLDIVGLTFLVIPALAAALIGQLASLWITLAAGFVIGIVQSCLTAFTELAEYRTMTPFVLAIVALLWFARRGSWCGRSRWRTLAPSYPTRPSPTAAGHARRRAPRTPAARSSSRSRCSAFVLFVLPALLDSYWLQIMTAVVIYSIVTLGLGLLIGRVGMVSLCQFVLMAVGAWVALRLELRHLDPVPAAAPHRRRGHRRSSAC